MKLKVLKLYDYKLSEREARKKFAIERNIIDFKKIQQAEKKKLKEEKDIVNKYRPFARFISQEEFEELTSQVLKEKQLRQRIEQLQSWRSRGITTLDAGEAYEKKKGNKAPSKRNRKIEVCLWVTTNSCLGHCR